jgi:hypothetical protein
MTIEELFQVYQKEREYQRKAFGEYKKNPTLSIASFLTFIEEYLEKAKKAYVYEWSDQKPDWLESSKEFSELGSAPIKTYEHLIKVFALTGAALETFSSIDPEKWRSDGVKEKWLRKQVEEGVRG